jgi:hypothetical protein
VTRPRREGQTRGGRSSDGGVESCIIGPIKRFQIKIEAPDWEDFEEVELPRLPAVGETIDTKYGMLLVAQTDASPGTEPYEGKIVCRMP